MAKKQTVDQPRARARGSAPPDWDRFIAELEACPFVVRACRIIGVSKQAAYARRESHPDFAAAWDDAIEGSVDDLAAATWERARYGWKPDAADDRDRPSDDMAKFLLRAHRREQYGLNVEVRGEKSLGELRALSDAELLELARKQGHDVGSLLDSYREGVTDGIATATAIAEAGEGEADE